MKGAIFFLALLGAVAALKPGFEYRYRYNGRVATGLPDLEKQYAAAGIMADVRFQVISKKEIRIQMANVEVGDFNGDLEHVREPVPISYRSLKDGSRTLEEPFSLVLEKGVLEKVPSPYSSLKDASRILQEPFRITLENGEFKSIEVTHDEPIWVTNIRKSLVNVMIINPLTVNFGEKKSFSEKPTFTTMEDGLEGRCRNWYSVIEMPDDLEAEEREYLKTIQKEILRSEELVKDSVKDNLMIIKKTVDFDDCEHRILVQHIGTPSLCKDEIGSSQCQEFMSRALTGKYIVRGDESSLRVERAIVEGVTIINPIGFKTELIHTITNQTMELVSVNPVRSELKISGGRSIENLYYELLKQDEMEKHHATIEEIVTGIKVTEKEVREAKESVKKILRTLEDTNLTAFDSDIVGELEAATNNLALLPQVKLQELYREITKEEEKKMFIRMLTNTGSKSSVMMLLDLLEKDRSFRQEHGIDFFTSIGSNVRSSCLVEPIMNFVMKTLSIEKEPALESLGVLNVALLANDACLSPRKHLIYAADPESEKECESTLVTETFIPYLEKNLKVRGRTTWQKLVYLNALVNLETVETVKILRPIIHGVEEEDIFVRTSAILGLLPFYNPSTIKHEVLSILMPIFENVGEYPEVRQHALLVMAMWEPEAVWWHHVALSTHHEPSSQVSSFVVSLLKFFSELDEEDSSAYARLALPKARPVPPMAVSYSQMHDVVLRLHDSKINGNYDFIWMTNSSSVFPNHLMFNLRTSFHNFGINTISLGVQMKNVDDIWRAISAMFEKDLEDPKHRSALDLAKKVYEQVKDKLEVELEDTEDEAQIMINLRYMQSVQALIPIVIKMNSAYLENPLRLLEKVPRNLPFSYRILENYVQLTSAIPNNIGLPTLYTVSMPVLARINGTFSVSTPAERKVKADVDVRTFIESKAIFTARTLLPWSGKEVASGFETRYSFDLPLSAHAILDAAEGQFKFTVLPSVDIKDSKVDLITVQGLPYTVRSDIFIDTLTSSERDFKVMKPADRDLVKEEIDFADPITMTYEGEHDSPFNFSAIFDALTSRKDRDIPELFVSSGRYHMWKLQYDSREDEKTPPQLSVFYDGKERLVKTSAKLHRRELEIVCDVDVENSPNQRTSDISKRTSKIEIAYSNDDEPREDFCLRVEATSPRILPLFSVKDILEGDMKTTVKGEVFSGKGICEGKTPVLELEGEIKLTPEARRKQEKKAEENEYRLPEMVLLTNPLFDSAIFRIKWEESMPLIMKNLTYNIYDIVRGAAFPRIQSNYLELKNKEREIRIEATRDLDTDNLDVFITTPTEETKMKDLEFPPSFLIPPWPLHRMFTPLTLKDSIRYETIQDVSSTRCTISPSEVNTFDEVVFKHSPSNCYFVAAMDVLTNDDPRDATPDSRQWLVEVRKSSRMEARIALPKADIILEVTDRDVKLNGQRLNIRDKVGEHTDHYQIYRLNNAIYVLLKTGVVVKVSDKVDIEVSNFYKSQVRGLCGNMDGETTSDLVGPKGCIYQDPTIFVAAWTIEDEHCPSSIPEKVDVKSFQRNCPKQNFIPTGVSHKYAKTECTEWEFEKHVEKDEERKEKRFDCESVEPTPKCRSGCRPYKTISEKLEYKCENLRKSKDNRRPEYFFAEVATSYPSSCIPSR